jgi:hypothetical protein
MSDSRFTWHVTYGFPNFAVSSFPKRREIMPIEEGEPESTGGVHCCQRPRKWMVQGNQIVGFDLRDTTIRWQGFAPAEVAKSSVVRTRGETETEN